MYSRPLASKVAHTLIFHYSQVVESTLTVVAFLVNLQVFEQCVPYRVSISNNYKQWYILTLLELYPVGYTAYTLFMAILPHPEYTKEHYGVQHSATNKLSL
jgi:hypothetical protein